VKERVFSLLWLSDYWIRYETHILPGGSRLDTTLAVPVPSLEGRYGVGIEGDMIWISKSLVEKLKSRWTLTNPGVEDVLDRVVGWADVNANLRIHLLGW
jgi:hypothetical protein